MDYLASVSIAGPPLVIASASIVLGTAALVAAGYAAAVLAPIGISYFAYKHYQDSKERNTKDWSKDSVQRDETGWTQNVPKTILQCVTVGIVDTLFIFMYGPVSISAQVLAFVTPRERIDEKLVNLVEKIHGSDAMRIGKPDFKLNVMPAKPAQGNNGGVHTTIRVPTVSGPATQAMSRANERGGNSGQRPIDEGEQGGMKPSG